MINLHQESLSRWQNYLNAKTPKEKEDALFELKEFARKKDIGLTEIQEDLDTETQSIIDDFGGEVRG